MILYFSGTGNSLWLAKKLSSTFEEQLISIAEELNKKENTFNYTLKENEKIFFVFPVHSWGPSVLVYRFLKKMNFTNYRSQSVYMVCTCGDNCGYTDKIVEKLLRKKSVDLTSSYSIQMPNNYILMKGFGVDSKEVEQEKLSSAPQKVESIIQQIQSGENKPTYIVGSKPFLKSHIVYPAFKKFAIKKNSFYATDKCISCGLCEEICPTRTIVLIADKPVWKNNCVQCTACINRCPVRAIEYGKITQNEGRYHHPDL